MLGAGSAADCRGVGRYVWKLEEGIVTTGDGKERNEEKDEERSGM